MATNSGWMVTSQQTNQVILDQANNPTVGTYIYYTTNDGNEGAVFLSDNHRSVANARKAIDVDADIVDGIGALSSNWKGPGE
jgi:hypothetical protein